jgi:solute:Na+ symporter, SSS family
MIFGIPTLDFVVIAVYSLLMLGIGMIAMLRVRNQEDFFLGGRRFGRILQLFTAFGQATSSDNVVGAVTTTARDGAGGLWSQLTLLLATPFYWFTCPWYRRMRVFSLGDFFHQRYRSRQMATLYSAVAGTQLIFLIGLGLKALSVTVLGVTLKPEESLSAVEHVQYTQALRLEELTQAAAQGSLDPAAEAELQQLRLLNPKREFSYINEFWLVWFIVIVVFLYAAAGGLEAAVWTDAVQGSLIIVLTFLLLPFAIAKLNLLHGTEGLIGAGQAMHRELPGYFFAPFGSGQSAEFTWYFIIVLCVMASLNVAVQANQLTANASARDESAAAVGFTTGTLVKRYCTVIWGFGGLLLAALYGRQIQNPDLIWGHATRDLLGGLGFGLVGLMVACLLSTLQSTASTLMISASTLFTKNVYEPLWPGRPEKHYVLIGRICGGAVLMAAALICTAFDTVLGMLKFLWEFNVIVAASFWCGLKWRGATRQGAWSSMLVALTMFIILPLGLPTLFPSLRTSESTLLRTRERVIQLEYEASPRDISERDRQIAGWQGPGAPPAPIAEGEILSRPFVQPPRSIYWTQGIEVVEGQPRGSGMLNVEMWLLGQVWDLSRNPHALNETIRYAYKMLLPFFVLILVSKLTPRDDAESVRRFFLRMRTKVRADRVEDERALQHAYANPESTTSELLFPRSNLEFFTWSRQETIGFGFAWLATLGVIGCLWLIVSIGA